MGRLRRVNETTHVRAPEMMPRAGWGEDRALPGLWQKDGLLPRRREEVVIRG